VSILITGAGGQVGTELLRAFRERGRTVTALTRQELDITDRNAVAATVRRIVPALIVNAAAYTSVDKAEDEPEVAFRINAEGAGILAEAGHAAGAGVVQFSTDYVFDGAGSAPYAEDAPTNPLNVYGASKLAGEERVRSAAARHIVVRTSWVFAAHGKNFVRSIIGAMVRGRPLDVVDDQRGCPTPAAELADAIADFAPRVLDAAFRGWGTYHVCGFPPTTWFEFAQEIRRALPEPSPFPVPAIRAVSTADRPSRALRPPFSVLNTSAAERVLGLRPFDWRVALRDVVAALLASRS